MQVELDSGKRVKVKAANVLLRFDAARARPSCSRRRSALRREIDLDLAWEFAPDAEFGFAELARDYFDAERRRRASRPRRCSACSRRRTTSAASARASSARRPRRSSRRRCSASSARRAGGADRRLGRRAGRPARCPAPIREQLYRILFKPDKNAPEYKAVVEAAQARAARAARPAEGRRRDRPAPTSSTGGASCSRTSRKGTALRAAGRARRSRTRCRWRRCRPSRSTTRATTEIDDALSVQGLGSGTVVLGIHIAAPALAIAPGLGARPAWRASGCPPSTCRAGSSRCCPTTWCRPTR